MSIKTYSELITFPTFEERFEYLKLDGVIGTSTFGYDRYLNQILYKSYEWKMIRNKVILRDNACDLAMDGHDVYNKKQIIVHHMNPISIQMIEERNPIIFDPEFLITTILKTHNAIHYGDSSQIFKDPIVRKENDTCPWRN